MANIEKIVKILFQGDDQVSETITSLSGKLGNIRDVAEGVAQPWADVADKVLAADVALAALAAGGIAYAFTKSVEFEGSIVELNKVLGDSPYGLSAASEAALDLSNEYGKSATSVLGSTADFKQAGYTVQEAMRLTKDAMDLVVVSELDAAEASALLVSILKGFGAPAAEAERLMDVLNETSNNYATGVGELAAGMAIISPIASQMGFSFEETAGILTPVIEVFRSGEEVARGFRTGLLNLTSDLPRVTDALGALGVSQTDLNGQMRSGKDIFYDVQQAFTGLTDVEKTYYAQQLAGKDQAAKMALAFDRLNLTLEVTEVAMGSAGSAAAEVNTYLESGPVAVDRFIAGFNNIAIGVGSEFREAAKEAVNGGTEIELALQDIIDDGTFDDVFNYIESFAEDLGDTLKAIANNLPEAMGDVDFSGILMSLDGIGVELRDALEDVWGELDLTTPEGLSAAVQKVVDGFSALINTTSGIVLGMQPLFLAIGYAIDHYDDLDGKTQEIVGTFLGSAKTITLFIDNLDLVSVALIPLAGASMVNAIVNLSAFSGALPIAAAAASLLGTALAAAGLVKGAAWLATKLAEVTVNAKDAGPQVRKLHDDVIELGAMQGDFSIVNSVSDLTDETLMAVGQMNALKQATQDLPESIRVEVLSVFASDGFDAARKKLGEIQGETVETTVEVSIDNDELAELYNRLADIPEEKLVNVRALIDAGEYQAALDFIMDIPTDKEIDLKVKADSIEEAKKAWQTFEVELEDGTTVSYTVDADEKSIKDTKKTLDKEIPKEKTVELKAELDQKKLETAKSMFSDLSEVMNKSIEWDAKVNITALETEAERVKAAFESIGSSVEVVTGTVEAMFSSMGDLSNYRFMKLLPILEKEQDIQKSLVDAQVRLADAQIKRLESGAPIGIQVESSNLSPALGMIFTEIMEMAQITASAEGLSLLGVSS